MTRPENDQAHAAQEPERLSPRAPSRLDSLSASGRPPRKTRDTIISCLIETLSTESVLSKWYGAVPREKFADAARRFEEQAFGVAGDNANGSASGGVDDRIEILQMYSKEISKRMLETVKARVESVSVKEESGADVACSEASAAREAATPEEASCKGSSTGASSQQGIEPSSNQHRSPNP